MASPFSVTATANSVQLDRQRSGEVGFTVFNATGRATRARVRVVPERAEAGPWLTLDGDAERTLAIAGADQVTVHVHPPPDAPAGSYPFRLEVIGVDNPDTEFTTGPTVTFEVPQPPKPKQPNRWMLPVAAVAVVAIGVAAYLLWPRSTLVEVPAVRGLTEAEARSLLEGACTPMPCFDVTVRTQVDAEVGEALAIATEPEESAQRHTDVTLVVSSGPPRVAVPRVVGMRQVPGASAIFEAGLTIDADAIRCYHPSIADERLVGTDPSAGTLVPERAAVRLYASIGPRPPPTASEPPVTLPVEPPIAVPVEIPRLSTSVQGIALDASAFAEGVGSTALTQIDPRAVMASLELLEVSFIGDCPELE